MAEETEAQLTNLLRCQDQDSVYPSVMPEPMLLTTRRVADRLLRGFGATSTEPAVYGLALKEEGAEEKLPRREGKCARARGHERATCNWVKSMETSV